MKLALGTPWLVLACVGAHATPNQASVAMSSAATNPASAVTLHVHSHGYRNNRGHALIALYRAKAGFPDDGTRAWQRQRVEVVDGAADCTFSEIPTGIYAVAILHDENDNLKMDTNLLGIPKEGFGVSNNARGRFGPPSWDAAKFELSPARETAIRIEIRYY